MKKAIYIFLLFNCIIIFNSFAIDCSKLKFGKFKITKDDTYILVRKGNLQYEYIGKISQKPKSVFYVKWISDCVYTLTPTEETYEENPIYKEVGALTVTIKEVNKNYYVAVTTSKLVDLEITDKIEIIH